MANTLHRLLVGDEPDAWRSAGFMVEDRSVVLGKTTVELVGTAGGRGIRAWSLDGVATEIDGLPTMIVPDHHQGAPQQHANMVFAIDHVVVETNNFDRTVPAFAAVGMDERKTRTLVLEGTERRQSFFWAGRVVVELIGPVEAEGDQVGASFWGLALASANLEIAANVLGGALSEPRDAVQPGRKIATLRTKALDISIPIALMSPHVANLGEPEELGSR